MLDPVLVAPPTAKPLDISEVRVHVRAPEATDDDAYLEALIDVATSRIEGPRGMIDSGYLISQTWRQDYSGWTCPDKCGCIGLRLPFQPVQSIASVTYYDVNNAQQTVANTVYGLFKDQFGYYVDLLAGQSWPTDQSTARSDAVQVTCKVGYGDTGAAVPAAIRQAMLLMIGSWYRDRENEVLGESVYAMPYGATQLLWPYRHLYC